MTITSVNDYNILLDNLTYSLVEKSEELAKRYSQATINIFDKMRFLLLVRYIKLLDTEAVFETHDIGLATYKVGNFVVDGSGDFYVCVKDVTQPGMIPLTNTDYWVPHLTFTYDYTAIDTALQNINRICGTNYTI